MITPSLHGADGISAVARLMVGGWYDAGHPCEAWVLNEPESPMVPRVPADVPIRNAHGGHWRLATWGWTGVRRPVGLVLVAHLHLLPIALPFLVRGTPVAVYLHGVEAWRRQPRWRLALLARAAGVLANSQETVRRFLETHPELDHRRYDVCPPGLDAPDRDRRPAGPPMGARPPDAVIVGRMWARERYKGHDQLLDVWADVRRAVPGAHLIIVGEGDDRARLEARVVHEGLGEAVRFTGLISASERDDLYRGARVFAMPSRGEGFGLVYLEAMHAGLPCIGSPGAAEEIIVAGETGLIVPAESRPELTRALIQLLGAPDTCERLGAAGAARVALRFTAERFAESMRAALAPVWSC